MRITTDYLVIGAGAGAAESGPVGVLAGVEPMGTTADFRGQLASSPLGRENEKTPR